MLLFEWIESTGNADVHIDALCREQVLGCEDLGQDGTELSSVTALSEFRL